MKKDTTNTTDKGLGLLEVISIVLVMLKVIGVEPVAHWPWVLVLTPIWGFIGAVAFVAVLGWIVRQIGKDDDNK